MSTIDDTIAEVAANPKKVEVDGVSVESQSIPDLIAAANHAGRAAVSGRPANALKFVKMVPPGSE